MVTGEIEIKYARHSDKRVYLCVVENRKITHAKCIYNWSYEQIVHASRSLKDKSNIPIGNFLYIEGIIGNVEIGICFNDEDEAGYMNWLNGKPLPPKPMSTPVPAPAPDIPEDYIGFEDDSDDEGILLEDEEYIL